MNKTCSPAHHAKPFISMDGISIRLYDRLLFEGASWEILGDQHWAVIGPNGSGKSTLVKALCGRVPVVKGKITYHFGGNGTSRQSRLQEQIAYVSFDAQKTPGHFYQARWNCGIDEDSFSLDEYLSEQAVGKINPYQLLEQRPDPAVFAARRKQVIELVGVEPLLARKANQLSNGERRKALLARALLKDPKLLILDNPFTGLDERFRARLKEILAGLMQSELRLIVVGTSPDDAPPGITHALLVEKMQVIAQGPREMVLDGQAITERTASFDWIARAEQGTEGTQCPELVRMEDVTVSYHGRQVLRGVNWTVRQGEHWALLGPNGAGKTTLLSLILGDNPQAYANTISLFGKRRGSGESIWEIKRNIGWVAPELHLHYPASVACFDVVCSGFADSFGLYHKCSPQQQAAARAWMQRLGIAQHAGTAFGRLSEGEQRMLLIARALVKQPALLVLDEPCQGLDVSKRERVIQAIEAVSHSLDTSLIYVTHDPGELPGIMTHLIRLDEGRVVAQGRIIQRAT
jgi:molybdate transport system ATP-binding protein